MRALILGLLAVLMTASLAQAHGGRSGFASHTHMRRAHGGQAIGHPRFDFGRRPRDIGEPADHTGYHYIDAGRRHERPHAFGGAHHGREHAGRHADRRETRRHHRD